MPDSRRDRVTNGLSSEEYGRVIEQACEAGMFCLEISGEGEPLLSGSIRQVVDCAHANGMVTTLITNGHGLTEQLAQFLFDRNVTLVVSVYSLSRERYERDNRLPGSFDRTLEAIRRASEVYRRGTTATGEHTVFRMAIHTTAQAENVDDLTSIRSFCDDCGIFLSIAPLAPVGGGACIPDQMLTDEEARESTDLSDNSIILSRSSRCEVGREVCGTCLYGLNIGYDGNLLFDAHAGYEVGDRLGNVRTHSIEELVRRQRRFAPAMFRSITGFCPVRDPMWPAFLIQFLSATLGLEARTEV